MMDLGDFYESEFRAHEKTAEATFESLRDPFCALVTICETAIRKGGKIVFFGNGGSAADAQHLATELTVRYINERAPIAALALTTDTSTLTAAANDMGFETVFSRQITALCRPEDVAVGISTSGNSANVINGLRQAAKTGCVAAGFSGRDGGQMTKVANPLLIVPSETTARIQEMHILLGHMLCGALEQKLGLL